MAASREPAMDEREGLFVRWELGLADAADEAALAEALRDPLARRDFARQARIAAALGVPRAAAARPLRRRPALRRPARVVPWAIAAGIAALVGIAALALEARPSAAPFARLEAAAGATVRASDGSRRAADTGAALAPGEIIETGTASAVIVLGADAAARLELAAGSRLRLPEGSELRMAAVRVGLDAGTVRAEVAPRLPGAPFSIAAPLATATVVGTSFTFAAVEGGAELRVDGGAVRLSTATDAGVIVPAGRSGLVGEGLASMAPTIAGAPRALPAGSRVLRHFTTADAQGWRGVVEAGAGGADGAWRSVPAPRDDRWSDAELRSPVAREGWTVASGTWLRFRYHVERFRPGSVLEVHLKPADESNYAWRLVPDAGDGWHEAEVRVDGGFRHVQHGEEPLAIGERIHGAVWCALRGPDEAAAPVRFWIRDAMIFTVER